MKLTVEGEVAEVRAFLVGWKEQEKERGIESSFDAIAHASRAVGDAVEGALIVSHAAEQERVARGELFRCTECARVVRSKQALATHRRFAHKEKKKRPGWRKR